LVSGQLQQIFFPDFPKTGAGRKQVEEYRFTVRRKVWKQQHNKTYWFFRIASFSFRHFICVMVGRVLFLCDFCQSVLDGSQYEKTQERITATNYTDWWPRPALPIPVENSVLAGRNLIALFCFLLFNNLSFIAR
jgi:hypothetical protein